ncbi:hypothetical protein LINGRAHAP2_LOCUS14232 [Linum grandiflorum]
MSSSLTSIAQFSCIFLHLSSYLFAPILDLTKLKPSFFLPCFCVTFRPENLRPNSVSIFGTFGSIVIRPSQRNVLSSERPGLMQRALEGDSLRPFAAYLEKMCKTTVSSGLASWINENPLHPAAESLRAHFAGQERSIRYIVPKFDTPEKLTKHMQDSYRTIRELDEMYITAGDSEPCYHCSTKIVRFDEHQPWFYRACPECSSAVVPYGHDFLCKKHDTIPSAAAAHRYRLKVLVSDSTSKSTFVLLGHAADRIMPIPATELDVAYPDDYGAPPPPLQMMIGQKVVFCVHLPRHVHASSYEDFRISRIWGLNMPQAQLLAQLPPPRLPHRTPSANVHVVAGTHGKQKVASARTVIHSTTSPAKTKSIVRTPAPKTPAQPGSRPAPSTTSVAVSAIPLARVKLENLASTATKPSTISHMSGPSSATATVPAGPGIKSATVRKRLFQS